jgi:hypothetical protein
MKYIITKSQLAKLQEQKAWYKPSTWFDDEEEKPKVTDCSPEIIEAEDWKELYSDKTGRKTSDSLGT